MSYPKKKISRCSLKKQPSSNGTSTNQTDEQNREMPQDEQGVDQLSEQESPRPEDRSSIDESTQVRSYKHSIPHRASRTDQSDETEFSRDQLSSSTESSEESYSDEGEGKRSRSFGHYRPQFTNGKSQRLASQMEAEGSGSFGASKFSSSESGRFTHEDKTATEKPDTEEMAVLALLDLQCDLSPIKHESASSSFIPSQDERERTPSPRRVKSESDDETVDAVQCDSCEKWRKLPKGSKKKNLPPAWFCHMSFDPRTSRCDAPEELMSEQDEEAIRAEIDAQEEAAAERRKLSKRKTRCGECDNCRRKNCGRCLYCKDMKCFGGRGTLRQACMHRKCEKRTRKFLVTEQQMVYESDSDGNGHTSPVNLNVNQLQVESVNKMTPHVSTHGILMPQPLPAPHQVNGMSNNQQPKKKRGRPTKRTESDVINGSHFQSNVMTLHAEKKKKGDEESDFEDSTDNNFHPREYPVYNQPRLIPSYL
eukprot:TRINITY_DN2714_c0_g1_i1.p1 TRINITY_DN2714_c0_g1~~TRINITY_DN2714_c0_g1_i1.p1  ORF type:complete len:479 (+),score=106.23 TRINITY_DN2714_c0_g1_i1:1613-3049(+)